MGKQCVLRARQLPRTAREAAPTLDPAPGPAASAPRLGHESRAHIPSSPEAGPADKGTSRALSRCYDLNTPPRHTDSLGKRVQHRLRVNAPGTPVIFHLLDRELPRAAGKRGETEARGPRPPSLALTQQGLDAAHRPGALGSWRGVSIQTCRGQPGPPRGSGVAAHGRPGPAGSASWGRGAHSCPLGKAPGLRAGRRLGLALYMCRARPSGCLSLS